MKKKLEEEFKDCYSPSFFDVSQIMAWYIDGVDEIEVEQKHMLPFLHFALANGLMAFNDRGEMLIMGMKIVKV